MDRLVWSAYRIGRGLYLLVWKASRTERGAYPFVRSAYPNVGSHPPGLGRLPSKEATRACRIRTTSDTSADRSARSSGLPC
jgi:hypothetical protein